MAFLLTNFQVIRPTYECDQQISLDWIGNAHAQSKKMVLQKDNKENSFDFNEIKTQMKRFTTRFACSPNKITKRGSVLKDFLETNFSEMSIFNLNQSSTGAPIQERMKIYEQETLKVFSEFYSSISEPPHDILHVSCTGYVSPSAAQITVAQKNWGNLTRVTHVYHMGCYAAFPAVRIAQGFLLEKELYEEKKHELYEKQELKLNSRNRVDIVHTELCTLHFNPSLHEPEQFVVQSLFADGYIRYSMYKNTNSMPYSDNSSAFEVLNTFEQVFPNSAHAMKWNLADSCLLMTISRLVPGIIQENIGEFVRHLCGEFVQNINNSQVLFAIHPGGPKIIEAVQTALSLSQEQVQFSFDILSEYGNMSSATLPHVWNRILENKVAKNTFVVSMAFGPGLTISGSVMKVI